ncbi:hypothetical protein GQF29_02205 [Coprobacillus cateniformis]|nr:hypothetical protein [Coprobacillus cateniformis]MVX26828.1 hypothetical protein [Coprobacillus cateniformis]
MDENINKLSSSLDNIDKIVDSLSSINNQMKSLNETYLILVNNLESIN